MYIGYLNTCASLWHNFKRLEVDLGMKPINSSWKTSLLSQDRADTEIFQTGRKYFTFIANNFNIVALKMPFDMF